MIHTFEDVGTIVYVVVDESYQAQVQPADQRPGPRADFTESEWLTVAVVAELMGLAEETAILGYLRRNHATLFPRLPDRSRYNRRRRALGDALNQLRRQVLGWLLALVPPDERPLALIDSLPVPVVGFDQARGEHAWKGWASDGYNASKQQTIYGFQLHVVTTAAGVLVDFVLAPAHLTDGTFTTQWLGDKGHLLVLGDNGDVDGDVQAGLAARQDGLLLTPKRANQREQWPAGLPALSSHVRQLIETVNRQRADQFHLKRTRPTV